jgi:orotate phosphoribosyltransferase
MEIKMNSIEICKLLIKINALQINTKEPFTFSSGIHAPIYCDNRVLISEPQERVQIIDAFISTITALPTTFDVIAGTATAGIPHAAWIADRFKKPMVYVRSKAKEHGKNNQIEGRIQPGQNALIIEDLVSTGKSALNAATALRNAGAKVTDCCAIFSYDFPQAKEAFEQSHVNLNCLTDFSSLLDQDDLCSPQEREILTAWNAQPTQWLP